MATSKERQCWTKLLYYEVWMLFSAAQGFFEKEAECKALKKAGKAAPSRFVNATLESFLLHYRNVYDFLKGKKKPKPDDIFCDHLRDSGKTWNCSRFFPEFRRECCDGGTDPVAIHKNLAHLTSARRPPMTSPARFTSRMMSWSASRISTSGRVLMSRSLTSARALVPMAASGWFTSCAIELVISPRVATRVKWASSSR